MSSRSHFLVCLLTLAVLTSAQDTDVIQKIGKTSLKFCANINFLFTERPMLERWNLAKQFGFRAVEATDPYKFPLEEITKAKEAAGLEVILLNSYYEGSRSGFAALLGKQKEFESTLQKSIDYCKALKCKFIQIEAGVVSHPTEENDRLFEENLRLAIPKLEKENIIGNVKPFNSINSPGYYLTDNTKALDLVKKINSPYIRLQGDLRNWEMMEPNLTQTIIDSLPYLSHLQIAQAPDRHEPDTCGTIDYKRMFQLLESLEYKGWIGLQYKPLFGTVAGLQWITDLGYTL